MGSIFSNGKNTPLNANSGTVPYAGSALFDYFQKMTFGLTTTQVVGFKSVQTQVKYDFLGVIQPLTERQLQLKPEGQRAWSWFWVHADPSLKLDVDSVVTYLDVQLRVMSVKDYSLYGFMEYHLVEDWTGSGPVEATQP